METNVEFARQMSVGYIQDAYFQAFKIFNAVDEYDKDDAYQALVHCILDSGRQFMERRKEMEIEKKRVDAYEA